MSDVTSCVCHSYLVLPVVGSKPTETSSLQKETGLGSKVAASTVCPPNTYMLYTRRSGSASCWLAASLWARPRKVVISISKGAASSFSLLAPTSGRRLHSLDGAALVTLSERYTGGKLTVGLSPPRPDTKLSYLGGATLRPGIGSRSRDSVDPQTARGRGRYDEVISDVISDVTSEYLGSNEHCSESEASL